MSGRISPVLTSNTQDTRPNLTVFKKILSEVGISLCLNEGPHVLRQEQALVVRDLEKCFAKSPESIDDFSKGLKLLCTKEKHFRKCVLPSKFKKSVDLNDTVAGRIQIQQDSLFRIFLKVNDLQKEIMNVLLDEVTAISSEEMQDTSWLRLLLNPLRYLPHVKDPAHLTTKLLDILDVANFAAQLEILDSVPEIVPDNQYGETAAQLSRLLDGNDELTGAIIDCLNALELDTEMRAQVQDKIFAKILAGTSLKVFPVLLQFLLTDCKSQNLVPTLLKVRNALDTIMLCTENNSKEKESYKILIFNRLQAFAVAPKNISDAWLNMIACIKVHSDHKPVDYLILFMLHATTKYKKRIIEAIFRKRIHMGLFKIGMLEKMFDKYMLPQLLKDYFSSIVEIGCSLLRSSTEQAVVEFASALFNILFTHDYMETLYRKEILESLILLTGASDNSTVSSVLRIISSLLTDADNLKQHAVLLMRLLEKLDTFELRDVKEVFEILCKLTCGERADESLSGLKDEIHMVVRKQLSSSKRTVKYRGIISAVAMAKHIALRFEEQKVELPNVPMTLANLPQGPAREAALLLQLTSTCTGGCPEFMGLYYDQVAMILVATSHLDRFFLAWLHETVTVEFEATYITSIIPKGQNDLTFSMQYVMNDPSEVEDPLGVNIAGLTMENESGLILLLASHFRLLRLIHYRQQAGDLSTINALLGCAIILPDIEDDMDLDSDQVRLTVDCLFHCVNWFRENINGFVTQKDRKLRARVAQRLQHAIEVEKKLRKLMEKIPDHKLPVSYFDSFCDAGKQAALPVKQDKIKNPRKKLKSAATVQDVDETAASTSAVTQKSKKPIVAKVVTTEPAIRFREMDTDLALLIKYPLQLDSDDAEQFSTQTTTLNIEQLKFILKDYVLKLSVLTKGKNIGLSFFTVVSPATVMNDLSYILELQDKHFKVIVGRIAKLLERSDGIRDSLELYTDEAQDLKTCFGLILEVLYNVFSWSRFQHLSNLDLVKSLLRNMRPSQSQSLNSANRLIVEFIKRLAGYSEQCLQISHAVTLIKTMEALHSITTHSQEIEKTIVSTAKQLLDKRWYSSKGILDSGKNYNVSIAFLVKVSLKSADIETLSRVVGTLQEEAPTLTTKEDYLRMLPSVDKQNFHVFYIELFAALVSRVKTDIQSLTNSQHLQLWHQTALMMQGLKSIAQARESKVNLVCFLKKCIAILNVFLSHGIPIVEIMLRSKPDQVGEILKNIQMTTRFLHHLCCYSKVNKDASLTAHVPKFRLLLETLVYKVKATLVANNCAEAFWMGTLRNKDLQGEDILTQSTTITEEEARNSSDEELPEDDTDDELGIDEVVSEGGGRTSAGSDVFD